MARRLSGSWVLGEKRRTYTTMHTLLSIREISQDTDVINPLMSLSELRFDSIIFSLTELQYNPLPINPQIHGSQYNYLDRYPSAAGLVLLSVPFLRHSNLQLVAIGISRVCAHLFLWESNVSPGPSYSRSHCYNTRQCIAALAAMPSAVPLLFLREVIIGKV